MSQNITLLGASYPDVPGVLLPKTGGGTASFVDVTDTTAAAADVASGKYFYTAAGVKTAGTASGGGGGALKMGVLRPDAEKWKSWTYDKLIVTNEGVTIPSYSTSVQTLKASATLDTLTLDSTAYDYIVISRGLAYPIYNSTSKGKGRCEYVVTSCAHEISSPKKETISTNGGTASRYVSSVKTYASDGLLVFWYSSSDLRPYSGSYGTSCSFQNHTLTNSTSGTHTLEVKSPSLVIIGNGTYMSSTYWGYITDIRYQYIIELWRIPKSASMPGFTLTSMQYHGIQCAQSANQTLT